MVTAAAPVKLPDIHAVKCRSPEGSDQGDFIFDRHPLVGWIGGRGCSKSTSGIFKLLEFIPQFPGAWCLVTEPTWYQLHAVAIPIFEKWCPPHLIRHRALSGDKMWVDMTNGCRVFFRNASNVASMRGQEIAFWLADEIAYCGRDLIDDGMPCLRQPGYPHQLAFTGTPRGKNWVYRMMVDPASRLPPVNGKEQIALYRATPYENPFVPPDYIARLEAQYANNPTLYAREVLGDFVGFEGLVFPTFEYKVHVKKPPDNVKFRRVYGGMDFGLSDPSVVLVGGTDDSNRRYVFKEFYQRQAAMRPLSTAARWRDEFGARPYFCDPHNPKEIATLNSNLGEGSAVKGDARDLEVGIRLINNLLEVKAGGPGLYVSPECPNLIEEMSSYSHSNDIRGEEERFSDTIKAKQADHAIDALRYMLLGDLASQPRHNIKQLIFGKR